MKIILGIAFGIMGLCFAFVCGKLFDLDERVLKLEYLHLLEEKKHEK